LNDRYFPKADIRDFMLRWYVKDKPDRRP
jgi:hypothetical protein